MKGASIFGTKGGPIAIAFLCVLALGCGNGAGPGQERMDASAPDDADPGIAKAIVCASSNGSRLAREVVAVDGATQEYRIIDTEYDVECRYRAQQDGTFRCEPTRTNNLVFFQDANCTAGLSGVPTGSTPVKFTRSMLSSAEPCSPFKPEFRLVGSPSAVAGGQDIFRRSLAGTCDPVVAPELDYYITSPAIPQDGFVIASTVSSPLTRVSLLSYTGGDGSSMCAHSLNAVDTMLGNSVQLRLGEDESLYFMPTGGSEQAYFGDSQCESVVATVSSGACQTVPFKFAVEDVPSASCIPTRVAKRVTTEAVLQRFSQSGPDCQEQLDDGNTYHRVADTVPLSEFALTFLEDEEGEGRLRRKLVTTADRFGLFTRRWQDTQLGVPCEFISASDSTLRCLPFGMNLSVYYQDAECTEKVDLAGDQGCQVTPGFFRRSGTLGPTMLAAELHTVATYELVNAACELVTHDLYKPTFEYAPSTFELGEKVVP